MSFIGLSDIPPTWHIKRITKDMQKTIKGDFMTLNFHKKNGNGTKTCYLRLSKDMNPIGVAHSINNGYFPQFKYKAFIPKNVPKEVFMSSVDNVKGTFSRKFKLRYKVQPDQILRLAHLDIMTEMQLKYPGLYSLSAKRNHELIKTLSEIVQNRIRVLFNKNHESRQGFHDMTMLYRLSHPHFTDFQLILRTQQQQEDEVGLPRTQISEELFSDVMNTRAVIEKISAPDVDAACRKYADRIVNEVVQHIEGLKVKEDNENDTKEQIARNNVRRELKKMAPYVPHMIRKTIIQHFIVDSPAVIKMMLYGEPSLPSIELIEKFLGPFQVTRTFKLRRLYNALRFNLHPAKFHRLMALDGTSYGGVKLVIRPAFLPTYNCAEIKVAEEKKV